MVKNKIVVSFGKKKIGFHFGLGFMGELIEVTGLEITELMTSLQKNPFKYLPIMMNESAKYYYFRKDEEYKYSVNDFIDFIDSEGGVEAEPLKKFMTAFTQSMTKDVPVQKEVATTTKKKLN